ncbi:hypothetical protein [Streptomyces sp. NPDC016845]|uniref:hypothetical protein n=1 Tax=Streptomyces sp. NPDC016845 TaxID=3364972 RepID=UPI00378CE8EE
MPTYHDILTVNLSALSTAADRWEEMAKEFHDQEVAYARDVHGISMGPGWSGLSADAANRRFDITLGEFQKAQTEAKAVASLLREAHHQFSEVRKRLKSARADATKAGMAVSSEGAVSFDTTDLTDGERTALHHDPSYQDSVGTAVTEWQNYLDQIVKDAEKADHSVQTALDGVVVDSDAADGTPTGFNGDARNHLKDYKPATEGDKKPGGWTGNWKWALDGMVPATSASADPKYGKEGSAKAGFDLFHLTGKGSATNGGWELSGLLDTYGGARSTANYGFSTKGLSAKAEVSAGIREMAEGRFGYGPYGGVYARNDSFAGGEVGATAKVTKDEVGASVKAFYGAKTSIGGGIEIGGIGIGVTQEVGVGEGATAKAGWEKENGMWKLGGHGFIADGVGAGLGTEITFDPDKFGKTINGVADAVGAGGVVDTVGHGAKSVKDTVTGWFD